MRRREGAYGDKDVLVRLVVDAIMKRHVDGVPFATAMAPVRELARAGEKVAKLVERARHDAVGRVEGLLDAVAVVDVNVDVEHSRVIPVRL